MSAPAFIRKQSRCHETIPSAHILNPIEIVNSKENDNRQTQKNAAHWTAVRSVCFSARNVSRWSRLVATVASHTTSARHLTHADRTEGKHEEQNHSGLASACAYCVSVTGNPSDSCACKMIHCFLGSVTQPL